MSPLGYYSAVCGHSESLYTISVSLGQFTTTLLSFSVYYQGSVTFKQQRLTLICSPKHPQTTLRLMTSNNLKADLSLKTTDCKFNLVVFLNIFSPFHERMHTWIPNALPHVGNLVRTKRNWGGIVCVCAFICLERLSYCTDQWSQVNIVELSMSTNRTTSLFLSYHSSLA